MTAASISDTRTPLLWQLLTLWGLFGIGLIQPILELYGNNPEVFIAGRAGPVRILLFVAFVTFGPVLLCALVLFVVDRLGGPNATRIAYRALLVIAGFVAASAVTRHALPDSNLATVLALGITGVVVWAESRVGWVRSWLRLMVVVAVAAPALFLGVSDAAELVWTPEAVADTTVEVGNKASVVMLVFDELPLSSLLTPEGEINGALFPNFARLAAGSHWFENAQSNSIATTDSVPILLTGKLADGARPTSRDHPLNLFTMLADSYAMDVHESITSMCPNAVCSDGDVVTTAAADELATPELLLDASIVWGHLTQAPWVRGRLPAIDGQWGGFAGVGSTEGAVAPGLPLAAPPQRLAWIDKMLNVAESLRVSRPGTLHYMHALAPHIPWQANPSGTQYARPEALGSSVTGVENNHWVEDPALATQGFQRHLFQLGLVDVLLGRIIEAMEDSGSWDESVVVVTADHGASFVPGEHRRWITPTNLDALYRVPLFIRVPGQEQGEVHSHNAYLEDVLPTIVDLLSVELGPEWTMSGMSLFDPDLPQSRPHEYDHFTGHRESLGGSVEGLATEVAATYTLIPERTTWGDVAKVGPHASLIGGPVAALAPVVDPAVVAEFDQADDFADLDPPSGLVPTVLTGRLGIDDGIPVRHGLVAVNGTVRGAASLIRAGAGTATFSAVVPEDAYTAGSNQVALLVPGPDGAWLQASGGEVAPLVLRDADGGELDVVPPSSRRVVIDRSVVEDGRFSVRGWSADTTAKETPSEILVFFGDHLAHSGPLNLTRTDVPRWFDSEDLALSGFDIAIPVGEVPDGSERVTVAARFGDVVVVEHATITES